MVQGLIPVQCQAFQLQSQVYGNCHSAAVQRFLCKGITCNLLQESSRLVSTGGNIVERHMMGCPHYSWVLEILQGLTLDHRATEAIVK